MDLFWIVLLFVILYWIHKSYDKKLELNHKTKQVIFVAEFTPCKYESSFGVIGLYSSKESAQRSVEMHKTAFLLDNPDYDIMALWRVEEYEVSP